MTLYHYTSKKGLEAILNSKQLKPSLIANNPNDARYGDGQYFSDILPGTRTNSELSATFMKIPFQKQKFAYYIEIDMTGLEVIEGRKGILVLLNNGCLDITDRIVSYGEN